MMNTVAGRAVQWASAGLLCAFAVAKIAAAPGEEGDPAWLLALRSVAVVAELSVAGWLVLDRTTLRPSLALGALGAAFVVAGLLLPAHWFPGGGCGCLGSLRVDEGHRVVAGGALVVLAGLRLALGPPSVGTRGWTPTQ